MYRYNNITQSPNGTKRVECPMSIHTISAYSLSAYRYSCTVCCLQTFYEGNYLKTIHRDK